MRKLLSLFLVLVVLIIGVYYIPWPFSSKPPSPTITVGHNKIATAQGSYCWRGLINGKCADMPSPSELVKYADLKPVVVSPEAQLKINFRNKPNKHTLGANKWVSNKETEGVQLNGNVLILPKEKGVYVYDIFARWWQGSSSYAFVIEVR